jgi:hypothetical protein
MFDQRAITYKLYPSSAQEALLWRKKVLLKDLWNAALEERIGAYRSLAKSIRLGEQEKALKIVRTEVPGWKGLVHTHEAQTVLKRLDLVFRAFFARVKCRQAPGFPRFRSAERFAGWGYKEHGNGFRVALRADGKHGHASLFGIGADAHSRQGAHDRAHLQGGRDSYCTRLVPVGRDRDQSGHAPQGHRGRHGLLTVRLRHS